MDNWDEPAIEEVQEHHKLPLGKEVVDGDRSVVRCPSRLIGVGYGQTKQYRAVLLQEPVRDFEESPATLKSV